MDKGELKEYLLIGDLWTKGMDSIHDMRVINTDIIFYHSKNPRSAWKLLRRRRGKKYLYACLKQHQDFTPLVVSVNGLLRVEVEATLRHIASHLTTKWK